jgi:uncharacterized membrane protein
MNDAVLLKTILMYCFLSLGGLYLAYNFYSGDTPFINKEVDEKSVAIRIISRKIIPLFFLVIITWFLGSPLIDFCIKDYKETNGIVTSINSPYRNIACVEVYLNEDNSMYYLPKSLLKNVKTGKKYDVIFGKRSMIVIGISEMKQ